MRATALMPVGNLALRTLNARTLPLASRLLPWRLQRTNCLLQLHQATMPAVLRVTVCHIRTCGRSITIPTRCPTQPRHCLSPSSKSSLPILCSYSWSKSAFPTTPSMQPVARRLPIIL